MSRGKVGFLSILYLRVKSTKIEKFNLFSIRKSEVKENKKLKMKINRREKYFLQNTGIN